jgi:Uma2 family endonuclease
MSAIQKIRRLSTAEYLALERRSDTRHEYVDGELFAMAGASREHAIIVTNAILALGDHLRGTPCRVLANDMKVRVEPANVFYYPDVLVSCSAPEQEPDRYYETQALLVLEVLSTSTEARDRMEKRQNYQRLAALQEYVLIAQDRPLVEIYRRLEDGWEHERCDAGDTVTLRSIELSLPIAALYEGVLVLPQ